jgi:26S proteasome regulatory subunit N5
MVKYVLSSQVYDRLNQEEQVKLLKTLIEITEGKIYVELEYSKCVRLLTEIYMSHNQIEEASKLIQDIQIETFGSVDRAYKVDYILFQMRILLQKGDYIRTLIVSNKVNRKHLNDDGLEKLKVEFYNLMIRYYLKEEKFIDVSKCYKILYDFVKSINEKFLKNEEIKEPVRSNYQEILAHVNINALFVNYVMHLTICPPELETRNMLNELNISYKKDLEECSDMLTIVTKLLSDDIIFIDNNFLSNFARYPIFQSSVMESNPEKHYRLFRKYLIQHILIIS